MSFLLDALRKSEQAGRQHSAPTIHSDLPLSAAGEQENEILPLLGVLLPAFLLMCWFGLQQFGHTPGAAPLNADSGDTNDVVAVAEPQAVSVPGQAQSEVPEVPSVGPGSSQASEQANADGSDDAGVPRTPVEQFAASESVKVTDTESPVVVAAQPTPKVAKPVAEPAASPSPGTPAAERPPAQTDPQPRQNHINYWELPGNVREQLPQFRISVLVYADQPKDRFILINGQRKFEGETLQQGLVLQEIRREGAIFSYRNYRFLVAQ